MIKASSPFQILFASLPRTAKAPDRVKRLSACLMRTQKVYQADQSCDLSQAQLASTVRPTHRLRESCCCSLTGAGRGFNNVTARYKLRTGGTYERLSAAIGSLRADFTAHPRDCEAFECPAIDGFPDLARV